LQAVNQLHTIVLHLGQPTVTGFEALNVPIRVQASDAAGKLLASGVGTNDSVHATFRATLRDSAGKDVRLRPGMNVVFQDPWFATTVRVPRLGLTRPTPTGLLTIRSAPGQQITLAVTDAAGHVSTSTRTVPGGGVVMVGLGVASSHVRRVSVTEEESAGLLAQRMLNLVTSPRHAGGGRASHRTQKRRSKTGR
jgi:hypothetical protein